MDHTRGKRVSPRSLMQHRRPQRVIVANEHDASLSVMALERDEIIVANGLLPKQRSHKDNHKTVLGAGNTWARRPT
eukprot:scaffold474504_cov15-Prasinocladus_malaysianus.AAC.1